MNATRGLPGLALASALLAGPARAGYECMPVPDSAPRLTQAWVSRCIPYQLGRGTALFSGEGRRLMVAQSFEQWSRPTCTDLEFPDFGYTDAAPGFSPQGRNENLVTGVADEAAVAAFFPERGLLAITLTTFSTVTGEILDADILFNERANDFVDVADVAACRGEGREVYDLRNTLVHEIGHLVGFDHDRTESGATMFASAVACEVSKADLAASDLEGLCAVYPAGQPVRTCAAPPTYDVAEAPTGRFRDQCARAIEQGEGSPCSCSGTPAGAAGTGTWAALLALGALRGRRAARARRT
jgi:uncharacterized protein (TIGR03382 family)